MRAGTAAPTPDHAAKRGFLLAVLWDHMPASQMNISTATAWRPELTCRAGIVVATLNHTAKVSFCQIRVATFAAAHANRIDIWSA